MKTVLAVTVRRFKCVNTVCEAVTFAEQVAGLTSPHARYTPVLRTMLISIAVAMAARAGARPHLPLPGGDRENEKTARRDDVPPGGSCLGCPPM